MACAKKTFVHLTSTMSHGVWRGESDGETALMKYSSDILCGKWLEDRPRIVKCEFGIKESSPERTELCAH